MLLKLTVSTEKGCHMTSLCYSLWSQSTNVGMCADGWRTADLLYFVNLVLGENLLMTEKKNPTYDFLTENFLL